jgi:hypothetical protein
VDGAEMSSQFGSENGKTGITQRKSVAYSAERPD